VAVIVTGNTPAVDGVPASTPAEVNVTPAGNAVEVNVGALVAVTVNDPATPTVKVVAAALVNTGGPGDGVTATVADAGPVPTAFLATTEHAYELKLTKPLTVTGDAGPVALAVGVPVQVAVKSRIALPPLLVGAVNAMVAVLLPGVPAPMVGAAGALAVIVKLCGTAAAARKSTLPPWFALIVQVPPVTKVMTPAVVTVQTLVVDDVNASGSADVADAPVMVNGDALNGCPAIGPKVIVCGFLATVNVKLWVAFGRLPLEAVIVIG